MQGWNTTEIESLLLEEQAGEECCSRRAKCPSVTIKRLEADDDMGVPDPGQQEPGVQNLPFSGTLTMSKQQRHWYEFFAGGGMARLGLGSGWQCTFANDFCEKKASAYRSFFGT